MPYHRLNAMHTTLLPDSVSGVLANGLRIAAEFFENAAAEARRDAPALAAQEAALVADGKENHAIMTARGLEHSATIFAAEATRYRDLITQLDGPDLDEERPALLLVRRPEGQHPFGD